MAVIRRLLSLNELNLGIFKLRYNGKKYSW